MTKTDIAKYVVKTVVAGSTSFTVSNIILNNATPKTKLQAAEVLVGSFAIGYMTADHMEHFAVSKVDETITWWKDTFKKDD